MKLRMAKASALTATERKRLTRARWRLAGLCLECGRVPVPGRKACQWCLLGTLIRVERSREKARVLTFELQAGKDQ